MKMSFWSQCQGLVRRLRQGHAVRRRRPRCWSLRAEALEARTLLSSTPAMVADVAPGAGTNMVAVGSTVYFSPTNGVHYQLWKSDGTAGGTSLVADTADGLNPLLLTSVNGKVFFEGRIGRAHV